MQTRQRHHLPVSNGHPKPLDGPCSVQLASARRTRDPEASTQSESQAARAPSRIPTDQPAQRGERSGLGADADRGPTRRRE
jgi:hypothetical protein